MPRCNFHYRSDKSNGRRDVAVIDLPGASLNAELEGEDQVLMAMEGRLAKMRAITKPKNYKKHIITDQKERKVLHVKLQKALYGLLKSALLLYKKLLKDLL